MISIQIIHSITKYFSNIAFKIHCQIRNFKQEKQLKTKNSNFTEKKIFYT